MTTARVLKIIAPEYVKSATTTTPPPVAAVDDAYIVPAGASGDWSGHEGKIAESDGTGGWFYHDVTDGHKVTVADDKTIATLTAGTWEIVGPDYEWLENGTSNQARGDSQDISRHGSTIIRGADNNARIYMNPNSYTPMVAYGSGMFYERDASMNVYIQGRSHKGVIRTSINSNTGQIDRQDQIRFSDGLYTEYDRKNNIGLTTRFYSTPDIAPHYMPYGTRMNVSISYIYVDAVNGDDNNTGHLINYPVKTWSAAMARVVMGRVNRIMLLSDVDVDASTTSYIMDSYPNISIFGYSSGSSYVRRNLNIYGNNKVLSCYGTLSIRMYYVDIVEDAGRVGDIIFFGDLGVIMYAGSCTHLNAQTAIIGSTTASSSYFYNTQLTPGKIFRKVLAGADPTWRYKNSNLTTG